VTNIERQGRAVGARKPGRSLRAGALLVAAGLVFALTGCDLLGNTGTQQIEVAGTWVLEGDYGERWTITETSIHYETSTPDSDYTTAYKAEILRYDNDTLNAGDTMLTSGADAPALDPGFAVIRYTEVANAGWGEVDKYSVFRWADNGENEAHKDFTQGIKDTDPTDDAYINDVFDTQEAAREGATNANGYFQFASQGAVKQE
jgi:hypothetical protein